MSQATPTTDELTQHRLTALKGIEAGLGQDDPTAAICAKLQAQYPNHLALVQAGKFLHGYDRTAYALHILKKYRLKLVGTASEPYIRVGFPLGNYQRRLWPMVDQFGIPYVVALGTQASGHTIYVTDLPSGNSSILAAATDDVIAQVINDLRQHQQINQAATKQLLTQPDTAGFQFKAKTQDLDTLITQDLLKMPSDLRSTYGENLRTTMARITRAAMAYGLEDNKPALLRQVSADVDMLKHYITQAQRLNGLKAFNFEDRARSAVELGRLVGGLINALTAKVRP